MHLLQVLQLGTVDYATALKLQETLVALRKEGRIADTLLLLEHPAVITLGRNGSKQNIVVTDELLAERGVEVFEINRGGDVTFHGPGQLVGYPICDLRGFVPKLGAVEFVRRLEETLIRTCAEFGIATERVSGCTGVWTQSSPAGKDENKKIAAIGVHISRGITSHGFALNVFADLGDFNMIVPCGIRDKGVTSMAGELADNKLPEMGAVAQTLTRQFGNVFGTQILWLESLESLIMGTSDPAREEDSNIRNQDTPLREPEPLQQMREDLQISSRDDTRWA
jgi:lipoyl(octanoyl) transferase